VPRRPSSTRSRAVAGAPSSAFERELAAVPFPGRLNFVFGRDLGLRSDSMDLAVISDFPDEATYHAWVDDEAHQRVRAEFLRPIAARVECCQIRV